MIVVDREKAEEAFLAALGVALPIRWLSCLRDLHEDAEFVVPLSRVPPLEGEFAQLWEDRMVRQALRPMLSATVSSSIMSTIALELARKDRDFTSAWRHGLFAFYCGLNYIDCLERPIIRTEGGRLHCADGPAIAWPGEEHWFWRGVRVPKGIILEPEKIVVGNSLDHMTSEFAIGLEGNQEVRRVMIERYGYERYMKDSGAEKIAEDEYGTLWSQALGDQLWDGRIVMVEVVNGTPEPDGSIKHYWLRVPPNMRTPREAVAWSYGLAAKDYNPTVRT